MLKDDATKRLNILQLQLFVNLPLLSLSYIFKHLICCQLFFNLHFARRLKLDVYKGGGVLFLRNMCFGQAGNPAVNVDDIQCKIQFSKCTNVVRKKLEKLGKHCS